MQLQKNIIEILLEYKILEKLWHSYYKEKKKFQIPRPFGYIEECELLITEFINGRKLSNYISWNSNAIFSPLLFHRVETQMIKIARWLSDYENNLVGNETCEMDNLVDTFAIKNIEKMTIPANFVKYK